MSILQNAIDSIQIGIEDYETKDNRRSVSAVRNISAGLLLLYKEKLCRLSPDHDKELLIRKDIRPIIGKTGQLTFIGHGKSTVDVQSIQNRFESLGVKVDWKRFKEINVLRNNLEHYYSSESPDAIREIISKSFLLIRDFVSSELDEEPQDLIGQECWSALLNVAEVYDAEVKACNETLNKIDWKYESVKEALVELRCPLCNSPLIQALSEDDSYPKINLHCKTCNHDFCFSDVVEKCIEESLYGDAYIAATQGGEPPYDYCLECNQNTFVISESCCVACDYQMEYTHCEMCGEDLTLDEQCLDGTCSYCQYHWEKIMAE
ncbi:hypothetical protein [Methylobacter sp. sgz302048]|uniref:hypothetical protein n=1 Tax=Methylobacter sp. sgz302048 TaxID=3455945 RepID=UPI003FA115B8